MELNKYQKMAVLTDKRKNPYQKTICNGFGIIGELEELEIAIAVGEKDAIEKEAGDVLWYCASLATQMNESLETIKDLPYKKLMPFPPLAEVFKKLFRDNRGRLDGEYRAKILSYISFVLNEVLPAHCDLDLIAQKNIDKLYDRLKRGVIGGSGDNR